MIWEWPEACAIGRADQRKRLEKRERKTSFDELLFVPLRFSLLSRCNDLGIVIWKIGARAMLGVLVQRWA